MSKQQNKQCYNSPNYIAFSKGEGNYIGTSHMSFLDLYCLIHNQSFKSEYRAIVHRLKVYSFAEEIKLDHAEAQKRLTDIRHKLNEIWNDDSFYNYPENIEEECRYALAYTQYMAALGIVIRKIKENELRLPIRLKIDRDMRMKHLNSILIQTQIWPVLPNIIEYCT
jgi:fructose/tagatose bisphosphate aldolase